MDDCATGTIIRLAMYRVRPDDPSATRAESTAHLREILEQELRDELDEPHLKIIHIDMHRLAVTCITRQPRHLLTQCARKEMKLCLIGYLRRIVIGIAIQGHVLSYAEASEVYQLVSAYFPQTHPHDRVENVHASHTPAEHVTPIEDILPPGIDITMVVPSTHDNVAYDRFQVVDRIESLLLEKCDVGPSTRIDSPPVSDHDVGYVFLYYMHCTERAGIFVQIAVSDERVVIGGPLITHPTIVRNPDARFSAAVLDALKLYHKKARLIRNV